VPRSETRSFAAQSLIIGLTAVAAAEPTLACVVGGVSATQTVADPGWGQGGGTDIAVVRLAQPVPQQAGRISAQSGPVDTATRIMGWGQTCPTPGGCALPTKLQQLDTKIISDVLCAGANFSADIRTYNPNHGGACFGDSGGPQVKLVNGQWELIGVTSRPGGGWACGEAPSIYTDVPFYRQWINGQTRLNL
jgi:secreted trypsin-like serine protease